MLTNKLFKFVSISIAIGVLVAIGALIVMGAFSLATIGVEGL